MKKESHDLHKLLDILTEANVSKEQSNDMIIGYVEAASLIRQNCSPKESEKIIDNLDQVVKSLSPYPNVVLSLLDLVKAIIIS